MNLQFYDSRAHRALVASILALATIAFAGQRGIAQGLIPTTDAVYSAIDRYSPNTATVTVIKEIDGRQYAEVSIVEGPLPALPPKVDLTDHAPTPGRQTFSDCVGWAVAYCSLSTQVARSRGVKPNSLPVHVFSPRFLYSQICGGQDQGSPIDADGRPSAVSITMSRGCSSEETTPYISSNADPSAYLRQPDARAFTEASNYIAVQHKRCDTIDDIRYSLVFGIPVVIAVHTDPDLHAYQGLGNYKWSGQSDGLHAMCIIGYDNEKQAFLIQNSWGTNWGIGGRCWVGFNHFEKLGTTPQRTTGWCYEAHAIIADWSRATQVRTTDEGKFFFLPDGSVVDADSNQTLVQRGTFRLAEATNHFLYGMTDTGVISGWANDQWWDIVSPQFPAGFSGGRAKMIAAADDFLYAITHAGSVVGRVPRRLSQTNSSYWEKVNLPNGRIPVDIRSRDGKIYVQSKNGDLYKRLVGQGWEKQN